MEIKLELIGAPAPRCEDPRTGKVTVYVKVSGVTLPISSADLGPVCANFKVEFKWLRDHEPEFVFFLPKSLEGHPAHLIWNIFFGHYVLHHSELRRMQVHVLLRWYGNCLFCRREFFGEEDVPKGWLPVKCTGCKKTLGHACKQCSSQRGGTDQCDEKCDPPCRQCQSLPPTSPGLD